MTTPVIFRKYKNGEVVALFPTDVADLSGKFCGCYAHVGQHHSASYDVVVWDTRPATAAEYADLLRELTDLIGYDDLKIYKRRTPEHREAYNKQLAYYRNLK